MKIVKLILWVIFVVAIVVAFFAFWSVNTGEIEVDLLYRSVTAPTPVALAVVFVLGWLFGLACTALWAFRLVNERRTLKRSLKVSESEVSSLRNLPLTDAD
ncbi:MAG: LapA family protein [Woeseiaceae bacterium]|nr:LapA family protein [Woeseiaceae bacterium]